jgi:SAM-dependent methyltransferase
VGDAEELDLEAELGGERFDAILFADVLEHLRDPAALLRRVRPFLAEGGTVVASIPNIAHASVRLSLLGGSWRYREQGLLDETHLRFFTREGIEDLFESSGYVVTHWVRRRLEVEETEIPVPRGVPAEARAWAAADPEATTYQFVVRSAPSEPAAQIQAWRAKVEEAQAELDDLRPLQAEVETLKAEIAEVRRAHEVLQRRLLTERAAFAQGIAAVEEGVYGSRSWRYTAPMRAGIKLLRRLKP